MEMNEIEQIGERYNFLCVVYLDSSGLSVPLAQAAIDRFRRYSKLETARNRNQRKEKKASI